MPRRSLQTSAALAAVALAILVGFAFVVSDDNAITRWDASVVRSLADHRTPAVRSVAEVVTLFGNVLVLAGLTLVAGAALLRLRPTTRHPFLPALALTLAAALDPLAKLAVGRPRPPTDLAAVIESSTGYPSGHSAQSAATFLAFGLVFAATSRHPWRWLAAGALMTGLVGLSRVVLGVHSPTDVLGGWCLGLICALAAAWLAAGRRARRRRPRAVAGA